MLTGEGRVGYASMDVARGGGAVAASGQRSGRAAASRVVVAGLAVLLAGLVAEVAAYRGDSWYKDESNGKTFGIQNSCPFPRVGYDGEGAYCDYQHRLMDASSAAVSAIALGFVVVAVELVRLATGAPPRQVLERAISLVLALAATAGGWVARGYAHAINFAPATSNLATKSDDFHTWTAGASLVSLAFIIDLAGFVLMLVKRSRG